IFLPENRSRKAQGKRAEALSERRTPFRPSGGPGRTAPRKRQPSRRLRTLGHEPAYLDLAKIGPARICLGTQPSGPESQCQINDVELRVREQVSVGIDFLDDARRDGFGRTAAGFGRSACY